MSSHVYSPVLRAVHAFRYRPRHARRSRPWAIVITMLVLAVVLVPIDPAAGSMVVVAAGGIMMAIRHVRRLLRHADSRIETIFAEELEDRP